MMKFPTQFTMKRKILMQLRAVHEKNFFHYRITFIHDGFYFVFNVRFSLARGG